MKDCLLVTRPDYDDATGYLFHYSEEVIELAKDRGIKVLDLVRPRLTRKNFSALISEKNPSLVFFNAHGDATCIYGDKIKGREEVLVDEGVNHRLLSKRIVYARACYAAASLGEACVREGGCFIGYLSPFSFWMDERRSATPLKDDAAKLFLGPSNMVVISLLKGNKTADAHEKSRKMMRANIMKLMKNDKEPGALASIMTLWSNHEGQVLLGDEDMKLAK